MRKADNLPPSCAVVTKSWSLNFLETSRPVQACNGTALPLPSLIMNSVHIATCYGVDDPGIGSDAGEICHASRPTLDQPSHHNGSRFFRRRHSGRSVMLPTHLLLAPGCEWLGAIHPSPLCACIGLSRVDLYLCYL